MSEALEIPEGSREVVLPGTGAVVDLTDVNAMSVALDELRDFESILASAKRMLQRLIAADAELKGSLTFEISDGRTVTVTTRPTVTYDAEAIEEDLRAAGCPEETITKIVKEEVSHKVVAVEAKKAASANSTYAEIIERHRTEVPKEPSVSISRR